MSDHSTAKGCPDILRGSEITRPQNPHQLQKMGRGKHKSSTSAPSIHRNLADNSDLHIRECARRGRSQLAQFWKSKETSMEKGQMSDHGASSVMSDALHSGEGTISGKGAVTVTGDCPRKESKRSFETERMVLSRTSICRMESSCVDWKRIYPSPFMHSGIVSSEWQRYTEFNVNEKTQGMVSSRKRYGCWNTGLDWGPSQTTPSKFASAPEKDKSMPEEFQFQGEYMVHRSRLYTFFEKKRLSSSVPSWNDIMGSTSGDELGGFSQMPITGPSVLAREENIHSVSGLAYKEKLANRSCLNLENEICEPCTHSLITNSQKKKNEKLLVGCSWPMPRDQSPKACGDSPLDASDSELLLIKKASVQGFMNLNQSFSEQHFQPSVLGIPVHEVGEHRRRSTIDSVGRPLEISINDETEGGQPVGARSTGVKDESHVRTTHLEIDAHRVKSLPKGVTFARQNNKDFTGMQNPRKLESTSALQMKEAITSNQETELPDKSLEFPPCIGTTDSVNPMGLSTSKTDNMDVEHAISQVEKRGKFDSGRQLEDHLGTEVSSRWVKRLKVNSDSIATSTEDYKMEDAQTTQRVHKLLSRVMNYSRSNSFTMAKCLQERQQSQKTVLLLRNNDSPMESLKESHPWIKRWCQKSERRGRPKTRKPIEVLCEPEKTKPLSENLEGKLFPSLAAMALMGKAINNFRPCEFRRRGSSLVWNTEGF